MLDEIDRCNLLNAGEKVIGLKQSIKEIKRKNAKIVFLAVDADNHLQSEIKELCFEKGIEVICEYSMKNLGELCEIDVGAAIVAVK